MSLLLLPVEVYFAAMLSISGLSKIDDLEHFADILHYQNLIPTKCVFLVARIFPFVEIVIAFLIISGIAPLLSAIIALCLFTGFLLQKSVLLFLDRTEDCGCYGQAKPQAIDAASIGTSTLMVLLVILLFWLTISVPPLPWQLRLGVSVLFFGGGIYFGQILILRHKKTALAETDRLKKVGSLELGEQMASFEARDQNGNLIKLENFRNRQLLLLFVLPGCPACSAGLAVLPQILRERPNISFLIIGGANREANLTHSQGLNLQVPFIIDAQDFVKFQYRIQKFPTAILLDEEGIVRNKSFASNIRLLRLVTSSVKPGFNKYSVAK